MSDDIPIDGQADAPGDLAAEYVLGTLPRDERAEAEHRTASDPVFAQDVAAWQARLSPLLHAVPEAEPPEGVFYDVLHAIGGMSHAPIKAPALSDASADVIRFDLAEKAMRKWRRRAIMGGAIAASLFAFIFFREVYAPATRLDGTYVAVLESDGREPAFVAIMDARIGTVALRRMGPAPAAGKSHELWAVGGGRTAPESLGVIDDGGQIPPGAFQRANAQSLGGTTLAISLEPAGGSTTGQPTGPVIFTGRLMPAPDAEMPSLLERLRRMLK